MPEAPFKPPHEAVLGAPDPARNQYLASHRESPRPKPHERGAAGTVQSCRDSPQKHWLPCMGRCGLLDGRRSCEIIGKDSGSDAMQVTDRVEGVVIGLLMGFGGGAPLVVFPGNPVDHAVPARSLCRLGPTDVGAEMALLFEDGRRDRPLIVGRIVEPVREGLANVVHDGETVRIAARERLELRVGKASIVMEKDGHITIRGTYLVSHASAANRIRGGSVNLN